MNTAIWWIRRDLRLSDNQALAAAMHQASVVIPVFILDPRLLASPNVGQAQAGILARRPAGTGCQFKQPGQRAHHPAGRSSGGASNLCQETGAEGIFAEADISPYAIRRDERVKRELPLSPCFWCHRSSP